MLNNLSKPVQFLLICGLAVLAWIVVSPMISPDSGHRSTKKTFNSKSKKADTIYLAEDYNPPDFSPVSGSMKDSFKPLIAKVASTRSGPMATVNVVPPQFADGESNWMYTGTADVDGVLQALLENRSTGENVFLHVGDTWKGAMVQEITDDSLVLASPDTGLLASLFLPSDDLAGPIGGGAGGFAPAQVQNPPMNGGLGPLTAQPDQTTAQDNFTSDSNTNGNNNRRRSGRRNGRRGGGGFQGTPVNGEGQ